MEWEGNVMPQYLRIADNIYKRFEEENKFDTPLQDCLNLIVKQLREDLKDTNLKLIHNYIDFVEGFQDKPVKGQINVDVSLIPNHKNRDEFVLWLASFIEKITEGGVKRLPPLIEEIPPDFSFENDISELLKKHGNDTAKMIESYFNSDDFQKIKNE
ncbi:hypothetical protein HMPREF0023_0850 [Acinetobacter sp. ATCC 27244]|jgi:hypothetical protein|nr:hypothetical protein HMPREF0023_0850 [Acinetobacter sp. ATCC 27244]